jgi:restriction system protein
MLAPDPRFAVLDALNGKDFEAALVELFELLGYEEVQRTVGFEQGADLVVVDKGDRVAVHAKRSSTPIRIEPVRQLVDGIRRHQCVRGLLVTNGFFTDQATEFAQQQGIELWDRNTLAQYVDGEEPRIDPTVCAECGAPVTESVSEWCLRHPAAYGGAVYCVRHQRRPLPRAQ